jgi:hypothetical protein
MISLKFQKFHDLLRGDESLVKGWFPLSEEVPTFEEDEPSSEEVKKIGILYDCHLLYFDDPDGEFLEILDQKFIELKATSLNRNKG